MQDFFLQFILTLDSTMRIATPIIFAALGGLFAERSGVVDIGLEGKILFGAFAAATVSALCSQAEWVVLLTDNAALQNILKAYAPVLGLMAAILAGMILSLIHGFACITHQGNQIISGVALNILVAGLTPILAMNLFHEGGRTPLLNQDGRFSSIQLTNPAPIDVPYISTIYHELISGHNILVYTLIFLVPLIHWTIYKTRFGLRVRAVGENPNAVDAAGISVSFLRYRALIVCGIMGGIAGAYLSTALGSHFIRDMSAGKGYLAIAALIFGKWRPIPTLLACLMFAFADALQARLQGVPLAYIGELPSQAIEALPYIITVLLLSGFVGRAIPPKAIGVPYVKER